MLKNRTRPVGWKVLLGSFQTALWRTAVSAEPHRTASFPRLASVSTASILDGVRPLRVTHASHLCECVTLYLYQVQLLLPHPRLIVLRRLGFAPDMRFGVSASRGKPARLERVFDLRGVEVLSTAAFRSVLQTPPAEPCRSRPRDSLPKTHRPALCWCRVCSRCTAADRR